MLPITTANNLYSAIGSISSDIVSGALPYIYVICGIFVAMYAIDEIHFWFFSDYPERIKKLKEKGVKGFWF
jgi:hypothetical protein